MAIDASHVLTIPLFKLDLPLSSKFNGQIQLLVEKSFELENRERKSRKKNMARRTETARLLIEGLFQATCCHMPGTTRQVLHARYYTPGTTRADDQVYLPSKESLLAWISYNR